MTQDEFISKSKALFPGMFTYENTVYTGVKDNVIITCPIHGDFTKRPRNHLQGQGCKHCNREAKHEAMKVTKADFLTRAINIHGSLYTYPELNYISFTTEIVVHCESCGNTFKQQPKNHLKTLGGCKTCAEQRRVNSIKQTKDKYLAGLAGLHSIAYEYTLLTEELFNSPLTDIMLPVICPIHGEFSVSATTHNSTSQPQGCQACRIERLVSEGKKPGGYNTALFKANDHIRNKVGYLYYIKVGSLYKIGITVDWKQRKAAIINSSKKEITLISLHQATLGSVYDVEQELLKQENHHRVTRNWSTELFDRDVQPQLLTLVSNTLLKEVTDEYK